MVASTAVTASPQPNQTSRNHGNPGSGSSRWVISQASPTAATQEPIATNRSSAVGRPRDARATAGAASSSYEGRCVVPTSGGVGLGGRGHLRRPSRRPSGFC